MERFAGLILVGGLALVAGLWATRLLAAATVPWYGGVVLAAVGVAALAAGIASEVTY